MDHITKAGNRHARRLLVEAAWHYRHAPRRPASGPVTDRAWNAQIRLHHRLEPFDLILLVVIGDLIQQGVTQSDYSLTGTLIVLAVIAVMTVMTSYVSFRTPRLRRLLEGEPIVLVEHGRVIERNLRRERMTREELAAEARLQQIADVQRVRLAVLETNGQVSFILED